MSYQVPLLQSGPSVMSYEVPVLYPVPVLGSIISQLLVVCPCQAPVLYPTCSQYNTLSGLSVMPCQVSVFCHVRLPFRFYHVSVLGPVMSQC